MGIRIVPIRLLCLLLFFPAVCGFAQGFEIKGESSLSGPITLTIYNGDSTSYTLTDKCRKGFFYFSGRVESPVLASLQHAVMPQPLFFYLENAEISIALNASRPEVSRINGSRSNSEYRYVLEQIRTAADPGAYLRQYVRANSSSVYVPYILYSQLSNFDEVLVRQLMGLLEGAALHTYHYTLLNRWASEVPAVAEGSDMPDFVYTDARKNHPHFKDTRSKTSPTLIFFGAHWCDRCNNQQKQVEALLKPTDIKLLPVFIDDNKAGWDDPYLQKLSINHLPYMILVDAEGRVTACDIRLWELPSAISSAKTTTGGKPSGILH